MVGRAVRRLAVRAAVLAAFLVCAHTSGAADLQLAPPSLSFVAAPEVTFPLGPGQQNFLPGAAARIGVEYSPPSIPFLSIESAALVGFTPITDGLGTTSQLGAFLGAAWRFPIVGPLSARAFARAGYEAGLVYGDPLSDVGGAPAVEAGLGASLLLTPGLALRLDGSWMYVVGANGSASVSLSIVARPRMGRPQPSGTGSPRTGLSIGRVELGEVYPALRRSYLNHPIGTVEIVNTGRRTLSDVRVSIRVAGLMEKPRESAARPVLKPGETWEAPVLVALDAAAARGSASSARAEISVTCLEAGDRWEVRHSGDLQVMDPHALAGDDISQAAAFVLPLDPSIRDLSQAVAGAAAADEASGGSRPVRAAAAIREVLRQVGVRVVPGEGLRRVKYPSETIRDGSGSDADAAVLAASVLEGAGFRAALVRVGNRMLVAVQADGGPPAGRTVGSVEAPVIDAGGSRWLPMDPGATGGFLPVTRAACDAWDSAMKSGQATLVPVRTAWLEYASAPLPTGSSPVIAPPVQGLREAVAAALTDSTPATGSPAAASADAAPGAAATDGKTPAARPPRRLLVAFTARPGARISEIQRASVSDSLSLALQRAGVGILVIPFGSGSFPDSEGARAEAARKAGADCYLVVSVGDADAPGKFSAETFDTLSRNSTKATFAGGTAERAAADPDWSPVVDLLGRAYGG